MLGRAATGQRGLSVGFSTCLRCPLPHRLSPHSSSSTSSVQSQRYKSTHDDISRQNAASPNARTELDKRSSRASGRTTSDPFQTDSFDISKRRNVSEGNSRQNSSESTPRSKGPRIMLRRGALIMPERPENVVTEEHSSRVESRSSRPSSSYPNQKFASASEQQTTRSPRSSFKGVSTRAELDTSQPMSESPAHLDDFPISESDFGMDHAVELRGSSGQTNRRAGTRGGLAPGREGESNTRPNVDPFVEVMGGIDEVWDGPSRKLEQGSDRSARHSRDRSVEPKERIRNVDSVVKGRVRQEAGAAYTFTTIVEDILEQDVHRHLGIQPNFSNLPRVMARTAKDKARIVGWSAVSFEKDMPALFASKFTGGAAGFRIKAAAVKKEKSTLPFPEHLRGIRKEHKVVKFSCMATIAKVSKKANKRRRLMRKLKSAVDLVVNRGVGLDPNEKGWDLVSSDLMYLANCEKEIEDTPMNQLCLQVAVALKKIKSQATSIHPFNNHSGRDVKLTHGKRTRSNTRNDQSLEEFDDSMFS